MRLVTGAVSMCSAPLGHQLTPVLTIALVLMSRQQQWTQTHNYQVQTYIKDIETDFKLFWTEITPRGHCIG